MSTTRSQPEVQRWWMTLGRKPIAGLALILVLFVVRLIWQMISPYTLVEDEAHYWEWSRHLDWSYYSKGPGVAWVIYLSTTLLGNTELAVRLPALIASALGSYAILQTAQVAYNNHLTSFVSALLWMCVPGLAIAGLVMTIDAPYTACWSGATYFAAKALIKDSPRSWIGFGLMIALGFIFKYTILLLVPGVLLAGLFITTNRIQWKWFFAGLLVSLVGLLPVLIWNSGHDWATFRHLLGHLGMKGGDTENTNVTKLPWTPLWMLEYIVLQIAIGAGVLFLAIFALLNVRKHAEAPFRSSTATLLWFAMPIFAFYLVVSLITQTEGNWALAGFVSLIPPAAWAAIDGVKRNDHPVKFAWGASIFIGVAALVFFPIGHWASKRAIVGQYIPISRMSGMREHAAAVQAQLDELREQTNQEPILMTEHYGRASQLAFYLDGHPTTYCISAFVGGRKTQYDLWESTDLSNPNTLAPLQGRPGLLMGGRIDQWTAGFDQVRDIGQLDHEPVDNRTSYIGYNFTNFNSWAPRRRLDKANTPVPDPMSKPDTQTP
ncbi:MAG: glycosyltransferase family 39 protein [Phycisphaerales bacterium]|nr:glycosyltransferase family 39 protein [Phycisphaerales bacterium]